MPRNDEVNYDMKCILWWTNIAMENRPDLKMYFLLNMGIFQPAMLVYQRVYFSMKASFGSYPQPVTSIFQFGCCLNPLGDGVYIGTPYIIHSAPSWKIQVSFFQLRKHRVCRLATWTSERLREGPVFSGRFGTLKWSEMGWNLYETETLLPKFLTWQFLEDQELYESVTYFFWCLYFSHRNCKLYIFIIYHIFNYILPCILDPTDR